MCIKQGDMKVGICRNCVLYPILYLKEINTSVISDNGGEFVDIKKEIY